MVMNSTLDFWQDIQYKLRLNRKKWWYGTNMTTLDWCWILGYRYWKFGHDFLFFFIYKYSFRLQGVQDITFFFNSINDENQKFLRCLELLWGDLLGRWPFSSTPTDKPPEGDQEDLGGKNASWLFFELFPWP